MNVMHHADNIFHRKMSSNNKQSIKTHMPKLDSSNYQVWAGKMTVFLRSQGLWNMVRGFEPNLPEYTLPFIGRSGPTVTTKQLVSFSFG
jgi:Domain of unknown function (DUF4219)